MINIIEEINTAKGNYLIFQDEKGKYFSKQLFTDITPEVDGYQAIAPFYKVPKMLFYDEESKRIVYEYIDSLNELTMHDALFKKDVEIDYDAIVDVLTRTFKNFKLKPENETVNSKFFNGRINFLDSYLESDDEMFKKPLEFNGENLGSFHDNIRKIKQGISQNRLVPCAITQGDPTDLNMSADGYVTDFEVAGENSIVNEIAIFVGCYFLNCYYYYVKYMNSPHAKKKETLEKYENRINCDYDLENNQINVDIKRLLPEKVQKLILTYLKKIKELNVLSPDFNLGEYIAMRLVSPVNINRIQDEKDKIILMTMCSNFATKCKTLDEIIEFIGGKEMNLYDELELNEDELKKLLVGKKYIFSISGLDNTGKSTQAKLLHKKYPDIFSEPLHINQTEAFPKLEGKELSKWWFDKENPERFVDTMYKAIAERYKMAYEAPQSIVILDKGIDFYDTRIKATLLTLGVPEDRIVELVKTAKAKYSLVNSLEEMKIIITAKNVDHIKEKNRENDEEYLRYMKYNAELINKKINEGKTFIPVEYIADGVEPMHEQIINLIGDKLKTSTQYKRQPKIVEYAQKLFGDNLDLLVIAGSAGKGKFVEGWSDIDMYVVLKDQTKSMKEIQEFIATLNSDIHVGITIHNASDVKKDQIDNRTRTMFYELEEDSSNILYQSDSFKLPEYELEDVLKNDTTEKVTALNGLKRAIYFQNTSGGSGRTFGGASEKQCEKLLKTSILNEKILLRNLKKSVTKSYTDTSMEFFDLFRKFILDYLKKAEKGEKVNPETLDMISRVNIDEVLERLGSTDLVECIKNIDKAGVEIYNYADAVLKAALIIESSSTPELDQADVKEKE